MMPIIAGFILLILLDTFRNNVNILFTGFVLFIKLVQKPGWFSHKSCGFLAFSLQNRVLKWKLFRS